MHSLYTNFSFSQFSQVIKIVGFSLGGLMVALCTSVKTGSH